MTAPRTLFDKIWDTHVVAERPDALCVLSTDRSRLVSDPESRLQVETLWSGTAPKPASFISA